MAVSYLAQDVTAVSEWADDSKEKAFNSSMDAWQNLENTRFYDNVQMCYHLRSELLKTMGQDVVFRRPLSDEEINRFFLQAKDSELDYSGGLNETALARLLKQVLQQQTATRYLRTYFLRNAVLSKCYDDLVRLNQENKFMMGFSDKDIEEYIRVNVDKTRPATVKKLVGEWVSSQDENRTETFCFNADKTSTLTSDVVYNMSIYLKEEDMTVALNCPLTYYIEGEWSMAGDTLKMDFNPETLGILSFDLDITNLPKSALVREKDSLEVRKQKLMDFILKNIRQADWSLAQRASLDMTGNVMFMTSDYTTPWGQTESEQQQFTRKRPAR